ncbi:MAG: hypothetical protein IKK21_00860 [Clostridia bacterium]|nr:hypothetical protein [Clostridia bacterium]
MSMMQLAGFSTAAALAALTLRRLRPEMGAALAVAAGVLLTGLIVPALAEVIAALTSLGHAGGVQDETLAALLKITGMSLLADLAAQTCRDAGEEGLALRTELAGRVMILLLALPAMRALLGQILSLAP